MRKPAKNKGKIIGYKFNYNRTKVPVYISENEEYAYTLGYDGKLRVNLFEYLPPERYLVALIRLREQIKHKLLMFDDCQLTGNKNTYCTWGLCCQDIAVFPERKDWIWPNKQLTSDKVEPLHFSDELNETDQTCPLERDRSDKDRYAGCFYRCRVFQGEDMDRKKALNLINKLIDKWKVRLDHAAIGELPLC